MVLSIVEILLLAGLIVFITHALEAVTGFGCSVLAFPFMFFLMNDMEHVKIILTILAWLLAVYFATTKYKDIYWKQFAIIVLLSGAGMPAGMFLFKSLEPSLLVKSLGLFIVVSAAVQLYCSVTGCFPVKQTPKVGGVFTSHVQVPPRSGGVFTSHVQVPPRSGGVFTSLVQVSPRSGGVFTSLVQVSPRSGGVFTSHVQVPLSPVACFTGQQITSPPSSDGRDVPEKYHHHGICKIKTIPYFCATLSRSIGYLILFAGGIVHGAFAVGGPLIILYSTKKIPDKARFRATMCLLWTALNTILIIHYFFQGKITVRIGYDLLFLLPFLTGGVIAGEIIHKRVSENLFKKIIFTSLLLVGMVMIF